MLDLLHNKKKSLLIKTSKNCLKVITNSSPLSHFFIRYILGINTDDLNFNDFPKTILDHIRKKVQTFLSSRTRQKFLQRLHCT